MGLKSYNSLCRITHKHDPSLPLRNLTDELDAHIIKQLLLALVVGIRWRVFPYYYYLSAARLRVSLSFEDTDVINTLQSANYQSPPVFCRLNHGFVDLFNTITCISQKVLAGTEILRSCMGRVRVNLWAEGITQWLHAGLVIERSRVPVPEGTAGEFYSLW